ncbi:RHS repeat-associated protein [Dyadobacter jejuensis]|uniref:RHS repeat-associated protein n=1 Tax=Dyadobacter jejuensis TaxID=1082580 RepID=A0A316AQP2_9BACT|nr:RHS repeat-associated core domain-containing protein [Dyadobacter jejuensis]PWJ59912.1 RHS repeat-associated protein [Dyadobacter jejuensis]
MVKGASNYTNTTIDNQTLTIPAGGNLTTQSDGTSSIPQSHINLEAPHNHLNLPTKFDFGTGNTIELLYDGLGNKLRKTVKTSGIVTLTHDYLNGIELKNNTVEAVYNEEGRALNDGGTFRYEYVLRDHLGNTRLVFTDKNGSGSIDHTEILSKTHYYPFGKSFDGAWYSDATAGKYRYLYNGKELSEEFDLNFYDYGARWLDPGLGSWWEVDPLAQEYPSVSPYAYVLNNPINAIDPDGRRVYFIGGANNDRDGWNYINRWRSSFANAGIIDFVRVNASHGKAGDVMFTNFYRNSGTEYEYRMRKELGEAMFREYTGRELPVNNSMINSVVKQYKQQLANNPFKEGEQFNLAGYSYGSILQAQAALKLANDGVVVDNLVLIGSPISDDSKLYQQLSGSKNIKNIIRIDIPNDGLSNPNSEGSFNWGGLKAIWNGDNAAHFDLARPGVEADKKIQQAVDQIKKGGVKN